MGCTCRWEAEEQTGAGQQWDWDFMLIFLAGGANPAWSCQDWAQHGCWGGQSRALCFLAWTQLRECL